MPHAVILAEGGNRQLRPLTEHLPTCLVPVGGTPILDHQVQALHREGIQHITVVGGFRGALVAQACRHYPGVIYGFNPDFCREAPAASALRAIHLLPKEPILLLRGDLLFDPAILQDVLRQPKEARVVDARGRGAGMARLSPGTALALVEALGSGDISPAADLFEELEDRLVAGKTTRVEVGNRPWAQVESMTDLARALKAHRAAALALVERAELELVGEGETVAGEAPDPGDEETVRWVPVKEAEDYVVRPLLKAIHR